MLVVINSNWIGRGENNRCSKRKNGLTALADAERRTMPCALVLVVILIMICGIMDYFGLMHGISLHMVIAGNCNEDHNKE